MVPLLQSLCQFHIYPNVYLTNKIEFSRMHTALPCMAPCQAHLCHVSPLTTKAPPATHSPHTCPPATHACLPHMPPHACPPFIPPTMHANRIQLNEFLLCLCEAAIESYSCMGDSFSHSNHYTKMCSVLV